LKPTTRLIARVVGVGVSLLAAGLLPSTEAARQQPAPHSGGGGGGSRATAPVYHGGSPRGSAPARAHPVPRATAPARGHPPARGTANGIARYGYGYGYGAPYYGYGYGYGYPYWGAGYGWWGVGWYDGWWGWPGYGYATYGPWYGAWYGPDDDYVVAVESAKPSGPAIVETEVTPAKAQVVLDGELVGFASDYDGRWDKLSVAPGSHTIAFQLKGYRTLAITFEASPRATYVFNDALVPGEGEDRRTLPAAETAALLQQPPAPSPVAVGRLRVRAEPPDAAVYLDGQYLGLGAELGRIHGALAVPTGSHRLEAVRPGYVSASRALEVGATELVTVELALEPEK
jgi:hypothetical protein